MFLSAVKPDLQLLLVLPVAMYSIECRLALEIVEFISVELNDLEHLKVCGITFLLPI
jgi:hypothetical protein